MPHAPQCAVVPRLASQPSAAMLLQSPKPAVQANPQAPPVQVAVAFAGAVQSLPHMPQCDVVSSRVSQPLAAVLSQSPKPALQVPTPQVPLTHAAVPFGTAAQVLPQAPQFDVVPRLASQPFAAVRSQSPKPLLQVKEHALDTQEGAAFEGVVHAMLQAPQCCGLFVRSAHDVPQRVVPAPQVD